MTWPGCHGVRLHGDDLHLGTASGEPLIEATICRAAVAAVDGTELWQQHGEVVVDGATINVDRALHRRANDCLVLTGNRGPSIEVDIAARSITVDDGEAAVQRQLIATFALPLLLHATDTLVVHGSSCARDEQAVVVCGASGVGKSTLLVALIDAGWTPLSEDLCALDQRGTTPTAWAGPPWVRVSHGAAGPVHASMQFDSVDKSGWDIAALQPSTPLPLTDVIHLVPPGGDAPSLTTLSAAEALPVIARHAVWLLEPEERGRRSFAAAARLSSAVRVHQLQLPRSDSWTNAAIDQLSRV